MLCACKILAMLIVGVALGLAATWLTAIRGSMGAGVMDGPWATSLYTGSSSEGGPYLRARIAVHGLLALSREELPVIAAPTAASSCCACLWTTSTVCLKSMPHVTTPNAPPTKPAEPKTGATT